jgi:electron transport complex protein RnfG
VFTALGGSDSVGWGIVVRPRGYGGPMTVVVGVDRNGKVTGVIMVAHNETPGLGTKAVGTVGKPAPYLSTFGGADSSEKAAKLDTITGATKSSRGVRNGVQTALLVYEQVLKEGGGSK